MGALAAVFGQSLGFVVKTDLRGKGGTEGRQRPQCEGQSYDYLTRMALVKHVTFPDAHFLTNTMGEQSGNCIVMTVVT